MSKLVVIQCPLQTRSGYGDHSADLVRAIIKNRPDWELKIIPMLWGGCPLTEFSDDSDESKLIRSMYLTKQLDRQPDLYIQITVPNEFRNIGKYNIGITAGIETTIADSTWIEGCNRMDLIIVPSNHAKNVFLNSVYDQIDKQNNKVGELKVMKPIEVLFEGIDTTVFKHTKSITPRVAEEMALVEEDFAFLYVGHWLSGEDGHDRKDVGGLISTFYKSFANAVKKPALVLKTSTATFSIMDKVELVKKIQNIRSKVAQEINSEDLPNIYLLHGDLTREDMNSLYNHPKIKSMVSFTKGEGFGRPLLEFTASKKPVMVSNWSGQLDFLAFNTAILLSGELKKVHKSAVWNKVILADSQWFYVDYNFAQLKMKDVFEKYGKYLERANKQYNKTMALFTLDRMGTLLNEIFDKWIPQTPDTISLKLPTLPKLKKI